MDLFFRALIAAAALSAAGAAVAGPLTPPAGPVAPTYRTLDQVEPRGAISQPAAPASATAVVVISQPGSYYLTGPIAAVGARHGIHVQSGNVTLDLNGFTLHGAAGSLSGIRLDDNLTNITIRNGIIDGWARHGVESDSVNVNMPRNVRLEGLTVTNNGQGGARVGRDSVITGCIAESNGGTGLAAVSGTIAWCAARGNIRGIDMGTGTVANCGATDNSSVGINAGAGSVVQACTASGNGPSGIGIQCGSSGLVIGCHVYNNLNTTFGALLLNGGSAAINNLVYANQGTGIQATGSCTIIGNNSSFNGNGGDGAGIRTTFTRNRIEGNTVLNNDRGIDVDSTMNLIIRNHASGNTGAGTPNADYDIAAGNDYGQIITLTGSGSFTSTDPNANYRR